MAGGHITGSLAAFDLRFHLAAALRSRLDRRHCPPQGLGRANDQLLRLHEEEEHQSSQQKPRPDPKRDRLVVEQSLQRRRVGKDQLQDHDCGDAKRQVLVAEMRP